MFSHPDPKRGFCLMKPVEIRDLVAMDFYGNLQARGKNVVFVKGHANEENNHYSYDLMLYRDGRIRQITDRHTVSSYVFEDKNTIWFVLEEPKSRQCGLYRLSLKGGEAQRMATIEQSGVSILGFTDENSPVLSYVKKQADGHDRAEDYEVLDESPWYANGQGFINGQRRQLAIYDLERGELAEPFNEGIQTKGAIVFEHCIYFWGYPDTDKKEKFYADEIYAYNPQVGKTSCLAKTDLTIYDLQGTEDGLYLFATNGEPIGLNSNPNLYYLNFKYQSVEYKMDWQGDLGNTVGTDCALVGGNAVCMNKDRLFFTTTVVDHNNLFLWDHDRLLQVLEWSGTIHSFAICKGELYFIGAKPDELQQLYKLENGRVVQLSDFNRWLKDCYVATTKPVFFTGALQTQQCGWVLYPKDFDPQKSYPAILDIHGGPKTVYGRVFFHEMQVWASKGYFVFFCNPFGSDGQGNEYADIRGKYGVEDYQDLMNFTDAVLAEVPQINPERLGVTGGSYGGFMTNWMITHTHRFKAAASQRSISNWISMWGTSDIGPEFVRDQMQAGLEDISKLWQHSPLANVDQADTPTLFIHSDEDYRCPIEQGYQMLNGLIDHGTQTKMIVFHGENHELSRSGKPVHRLRRLEEITKWMDDHLKGLKDEANV